MLKNYKHIIKKNYEIFGLVILIIVTIIFTSYYDYRKSIKEQTYYNFIENIYFKKTLNQIFNSLEPKYKKVKHKIKPGETFDKILEDYSIDKKKLSKLKNLQKKSKFKQRRQYKCINFSLDKTTNKITEFTYQISNTQKVVLIRNIENENLIKILTLNFTRNSRRKDKYYKFL